MELFKIKRDIPFMSYGKLTTFISLVTFIAAVFFLVTKGLNFSVEFTGGTVMEVQYQQGVDVNKTREKLDTLKMGEVQVQALGTNKHIMIRLPNKEGVTSAQLSNQVMDLLKKSSPTLPCAKSNLSAAGRRRAGDQRSDGIRLRRGRYHRLPVDAI